MLEQNDEEDPSRIIYYLSLDNSGRPKLALDQILQAERNSILHIELMNGLEITNQINLISNAQENFPYELQERLLKQENINKEDFSQFVFQPNEISTSIIYDIKLERTGAIQFFFLYNELSTNNEKSTLPFYITVLPKVVIQGREIKLDDIQLQTILSKSLGKINEFEKYFKEASKLKYNFVHFTPIQQLGISESLYCLRDNTKINNIFFDNNNLSEEDKKKLMKEQLDKGRDIYGIGSLVDIVLNHASDNSEWLRDHPECGYNLENTPWLNCAYAFDCVLQDYSNAFCDCKTSRRCQPYVNNETDLNEIMGDLWNIVNRANLHEFFMMNIELNKRLLSDFYEKFNKERNKYTHEINSIRVGNDNEAMEYIFHNCLEEIGYERNGVKINAEKFGCCLIKLFNYNVGNRNQFFAKAEHIMFQCNERWKRTIPEWIKGGMNNIRGGMHWEFIQNHNKAVRVKKPLISPYFAVFDKNDKRKIFACNGWVGESEDPNNPAPNFTEKGTYYYFKRKVNIWSDCPKLNYGNSPSDCPYLIKHMTKYVQDMATMFNGFRLDNAHSTPIFIAEYLAQKAREVNPDLIIMAELFTKKEKEISFVNRIGINLLIRELIWCNDARTLSAQIHRFGGGYDHMLGKIEENKFDYVKNDDKISLKNMKYLLPSLPHSIIFDLTHDNETYLQKMNNLALNLTNMACNSFSSTAIGSTRGFDQLFPIQPSVVNEQRRYVYDDEFNNMFHGDEHHRTAPKQLDKKPTKEEPKEILTKFDFRCSYANKVDLALSSRGWKPDIHLKKVGNDLFSTEISLKNNQKILYKFVINGENWVCDDTKPKEDDGKGNVNNVITLGNSFTFKSSNTSDNFGTNRKEFNTKDLKLLRRQLNVVRNDISLYKNEFFLHQENQFLCIFRTFVPEENYLENIPNFDGYALICRTGYDQSGTIPARIELPGIYSEFVCGSTMKIGRIDIDGFKRRSDLYGTDSDVYFTKNGSWLNGFSNISQEKGRTIINFNGNMPCNTAIILKFKLTDEVRNALVNIEKDISQINNDWKNLTKNVDLCDINLVLYKCEREERDNTNGERGTYGFDNFGLLCYAGISHLHKKLNEFKLTKENNTILDNIRAGDWLLDYTIKRYKDQPNLSSIYNILCSILDNYKKLYVHHKPVYITKIIDTLYNIMIMKLYDLMKNKDIINFSSFSRLLLNAVP
jgi:glycogen debranching enzyme